MFYCKLLKTFNVRDMLFWSILFYLFSFKDLNECETHQDDCGQHATCVNTDGSFDCECADGYDGDGRSCEGNH